VKTQTNADETIILLLFVFILRTASTITMGQFLLPHTNVYPLNQWKYQKRTWCKNLQFL